MKRKAASLTICLLLLLILATTTLVTTQQQIVSSASTSLVTNTQATENTWTTMASLPTPRVGLGVAVVNGKIYAIGGARASHYINTNEEYDPATNTWATRKSMPTGRSDFGIAVYQNKIYVIGGYTESEYVGHVTGANEVYDPLSDTWETKASMPTARQFLCANVVNGKIYLIGGSKSVGDWASPDPHVNEVYDPATDSWTTKTPPPIQVGDYASTVVDNKIYVISGSNSGNQTQVYDPETDSWSYAASIPNAETGARAGATTGVMAPKRIYVLGGYGDTSNQVYDPETDTWTVGAPMPTGGYDLGVAVVNDLLYAIGGGRGSVNQQYTPFGYGTIPPVVSIVSPENKTYAVSNVFLTFAVNKPVSWMGYSSDGQTNVTVTGNITLTDLPNGYHNLTVYANDTLGNMGASETVYFTIALPSEPFPTTWIAAATVIIVTGVIVTLGVIIYRRKRSASKKTP